MVCSFVRDFNTLKINFIIFNSHSMVGPFKNKNLGELFLSNWFRVCLRKSENYTQFIVNEKL